MLGLHSLRILFNVNTKDRCNGLQKEEEEAIRTVNELSEIIFNYVLIRIL